MIENSLAYGGSKAFCSNRARELANSLEVVDDQLVEKYSKDIAEANTVEGLIAVLEDMDNNNINLVGSRGYVYMSEAMASTLKFHNDIKDISKATIAIEGNFYTRSCGLREKAIKLLLGLDISEPQPGSTIDGA